jgi:hypothetical protein
MARWKTGASIFENTFGHAWAKKTNSSNDSPFGLSVHWLKLLRIRNSDIASGDIRAIYYLDFLNEVTC